jgi:hypothetical protein
VVGDGAQIYSTPHFLYCYDKDDNVVPLVGTLAQKAELLKKAANFGKGPTTLLDGTRSTDETPRKIGFSSGIGASEWQPIRVHNARDYQELLGQHEMNKGELEKFSVDKDNVKLQGAVNPFQHLEQFMNQGDIRNRDLKTAGEFMFKNMTTILMTGAEIALDAVTEGGYSAIVQSISALDSATGLTDKIQNELNKVLGHDKRAEAWTDAADDLFEGAWKVDDSDEIDRNIINDRRVGIQFKKFQERKQLILSQLSPEERGTLESDPRYKVVELPKNRDKNNDFSNLQQFNKANQFLKFSETQLQNREYVNKVQNQAKQYGLAGQETNIDIIPGTAIQGVHSLNLETNKINTDINTITKVHKEQVQGMKDKAKHLAEKQHATSDHYASVSERTFADSLVTKEERLEWDKLRQIGKKTKQEFDQFKRDKSKQYYEDKGETRILEHVKLDNKVMEKLVNKHLDKITKTKTNDTNPKPADSSPTSTK